MLKILPGAAGKTENIFEMISGKTPPRDSPRINVNIILTISMLEKAKNAMETEERSAVKTR